MTGAGRLPIPDRSRAVLIGTSDYRHADRLSALPAVRNNLTDLLVALTAPDTGILPRQRCTTIDTPDTPDSFLDRLHAVADQAQDLLVVYYAGHGILHETKDDVLYLAVRQTDPRRPAGNAVPFDWVREAIQHSPARTKLLILDCCYSGAAIGAMSGRTVDPRDIEVSGTCVITSSAWNKISLSPPGEHHTAFTGELIRLLLHGSPIDGEPLTVPALYRGLRATLANRQLPLPKMQATDTSVDLLLRRTPDGGPPRSTLPPPESDSKRPPHSEPDPDTGGGGRRADAHIGSARQRQAPPPPPRSSSATDTSTQPGWLRYARALLWPFAVFGFGLLVGGLIGAAAGTDRTLIQEDQDMAREGGIFFVVCAILLIALRVWRVKYSTARPARQPRWLARLTSTGSLVAMLVFCLLFVAVAATGGLDARTGSRLANGVAATITFGSAALACATALLRRSTR